MGSDNNCDCTFPAPETLPADQSETVEAALIALREMFPDRALIVRNNGSWPPSQQQPDFGVEIVVYGMPIFYGATLPEAMQAARQWHKENQ